MTVNPAVQDPSQAGRVLDREVRRLAPAKLNLFLLITGRRPDGYHLLQSLFLPIDWSDELTVRARQDGQLLRQGPLDWPVAQDLGLRAAQALKAWAGQPDLGAEISIQKSIPHGAGLGGGSSDAAAVLLALCELWNLSVPQDTLAEIGLGLGADVPFFLQRQPALVTGVGEQIQPMPVVANWFVVAVPPVQVPTADIFRAPELTRNSPPLTIASLSAASTQPIWRLGRNDLQAVAERQFPAVRQLVQAFHVALAEMGEAQSSVSPMVRMSGSGGAVFASCASQAQAQVLAQTLTAFVEEGTQLRVCQRAR